MMVTALSLTILAAFGMGAEAGDHNRRKEPPRSIYLAKYLVGGEIRYSKGPAGKIVTVSAAHYQNSSAYVCTPSGFGQKARCYIPAR
jgi:hypothetical protein